MSEKINEKPSGSRVNTAVRLINRVIRYMLHYYKIPFLMCARRAHVLRGESP